MKTATRNRQRSKESQEVLERFFMAFDALQIVVNLGVSADWLLTGNGKNDEITLYLELKKENMKKVLLLMCMMLGLCLASCKDDEEETSSDKYVTSNIDMVLDSVQYCKDFLWLFPFNYDNVMEVENYFISYQSEKKLGVWYYSITLTTVKEADPAERENLSRAINERLGSTREKEVIWKENADSWTWSMRF